jgi:hypothetical protein
MSEAQKSRSWTKHFGLPQVPIVIMNPEAVVQIKEDGVRGRCRVAKACDVDWERVTHWRWDKQPDAGEAEPKQPEEMSYKECVAERQRIKAELTRMQAALSAAKRSQDNLAIDNWGHRIQALTQRASAVKLRQHETRQRANRDALKQAAEDILPSDLLRKLYERANAIEESMLR